MGRWRGHRSRSMGVQMWRVHSPLHATSAPSRARGRARRSSRRRFATSSSQEHSCRGRFWKLSEREYVGFFPSADSRTAWSQSVGPLAGPTFCIVYIDLDEPHLLQSGRVENNVYVSENVTFECRI